MFWKVFGGYVCGWAVATVAGVVMRNHGFADAAYDKIAAKVVEQMPKEKI